MGNPIKTGGADAVQPPAEATVESRTPARARLRTDDGVLLLCEGEQLPAGMVVGDRLVGDKALYLATLDQWMCQKVRCLGAPSDAPSAGPF